jgi:hypothetical protein
MPTDGPTANAAGEPLPDSHVTELAAEIAHSDRPRRPDASEVRLAELRTALSNETRLLSRARLWWRIQHEKDAADRRRSYPNPAGGFGLILYPYRLILVPIALVVVLGSLVWALLH